MTRKKKRVAIIDGDGLVFQAVTNKEHRTEVHNEDDEWWELLNMKAAKEEFQTRIIELLAVLQCTKGGVVFAFGAKSYFRKKLDPSYKAKRKNRKPLGYWAFVDWVRSQYQNHVEPTFEADDVLGVLHSAPGYFDCDGFEFESVVVSNDKDMRTIPGLLYNPDNTDPVETITEEQALRCLFIQSLTGDSTDGYGGAKGVGPVKAASIADGALQGAKVIDDVFDDWIVKTYIDAGQTADDALLNCRLARILSTLDVKLNDPYDQDGEWTHELWTPSSFKTRDRRSTRGSTGRRRRVRRAIRPVSDSKK